MCFKGARNQLTSAGILLLTVMLAACGPTLLDKEPPLGSLEEGHRAYFKNDGRCADKQVIRVTGGANGDQEKRPHVCVTR